MPAQYDFILEIFEHALIFLIENNLRVPEVAVLILFGMVYTLFAALVVSLSSQNDQEEKYSVKVIVKLLCQSDIFNTLCQQHRDNQFNKVQKCCKSS